MSDKPALKLKIKTCEWYDNQWNPTLGHTFYGNTEEELAELIKAHRETDSFFDASFTGTFKWKDNVILLKNKMSDIKEH